MAKHLTDKQRKKVIADYIQCGNYSEVARKHKISPATVKRAVNADPKTVKKVEQKKEENTADVLSYLERKKDVACEIIDAYLNEMKNAEKIEKTPLNQLATSLGILIDKFTSKSVGVGHSGASNNLFDALKESMGK